jgi:long-chain acyl-CoA synthetase
VNIDFLIESMNKNSGQAAVITDGNTYTYSDILEEFRRQKERISALKMPRHSVTAIISEFSAQAVALFLALAEHDCILVPITPGVVKREYYINVSQTEYIFYLSTQKAEFTALKTTVDNPLLCEIRKRDTAGIVLFSSGTTGNPKAALHDMSRLMPRFKKAGKKLVTLAFLRFDHIGGINTLFYTMAAGGTIVTTDKRSPDNICTLIQKHKVELLPTSPTFINLLLLSGKYKSCDLSSLKIISYGTEPMPKYTLDCLHRILPEVKLKQTYGLSEVGIVSTKSENSESLWMKLGGDGYSFKIVNGILFIKSPCAILGYLNATCPFDADGWFNTGDNVEVKGDYVRIKGRATDLINVGGEKIYPIEIENCLLKHEKVLDVKVRAEDSPVTGKYITATIMTDKENNNREFKKEIRRYCSDNLEKYAIPARIILTDKPLYSERFKKI